MVQGVGVGATAFPAGRDEVRSTLAPLEDAEGLQHDGPVPAAAADAVAPHDRRPKNPAMVVEAVEHGVVQVVLRRGVPLAPVIGVVQRIVGRGRGATVVAAGAGRAAPAGRGPVAVNNVEAPGTTDLQPHQVLLRPDLLDVVLGQVLKDVAHVYVLLHRGPVQSHAEFFGQPFDLLTAA